MKDTFIALTLLLSLINSSTNTSQFSMLEKDGFDLSYCSFSDLKLAKIETLIDDSQYTDALELLKQIKHSCKIDKGNSVPEQYLRFQYLHILTFRGLYKYNDALKVGKSILKSLRNTEEKTTTVYTIKVKSQMGLIYYYLGEPDSSNSHFKEALSLVQNGKILIDNEKNTPMGAAVGSLLANYGISLARSGYLDSALVCFKNAHIYYLGKEPNQQLIESYSRIGLTFDLLNSPEEAMKYYFEALNICESYDLSATRLLSNLARILLVQKDYESAIKYALLSLESNATEDSMGAFETLGTTYLNKLDLANAKKYYLLNHQEALELGQDRRILLSKINLAIVHSDIGEIDSAKILLSEAHERALDSKSYRSLAQIIDTYARVYIKSNQLDLAKSWINRGMQLTDSLSFSDVHLSFLEKIQKIYGKKKKYDSAFFFMTKFHEAYAQVSDQRYTREVADIETKYETEKKDKEILQLENTQQAQEISLAKNRITQYSLVGVLISLLLAGSFFWKDRQRRLLLEKYKAEEAEKNRIARELHDSIANELLNIGESLSEGAADLKVRILETDRELRKFAHQLETKRKFESHMADILNDYISHGKLDGRLDIKVDFFPKPFDIENQELKLNLFRIWQELISNTLKHSDASKCFFQLGFSGKKIEVVYKDNGKDFLGSQQAEGMGLQNIRERVDLLKGKLNITHTATGFGMSIEIPVKKSHIKFT